MKIKLETNDSISCSCEWLGTIVTFIFLPYLAMLMIMGLATLINKIVDWKESKKSPLEKCKDQLADLQKWLTRFDEDPDWYSLKTAKVDPSIKSPNLTAKNIISIEQFKSKAKQLKDIFSKFANISDGNITSDIEKMFKSVFSKADLAYKNKKPVGFNWKYGVAKFPTDPYYKDIKQCGKAVETETRKIIPEINKIVKIVDDILKEETKDVDKETLIDRVAYIETAEVLMNLVYHFTDTWNENIGRLWKIDIIGSDANE